MLRVRARGLGGQGLRGLLVAGLGGQRRIVAGKFFGRECVILEG